MTRNGFTLVEMLVALFIFALLSSAGVAMMRFTVTNQEVVRENTSRTGEFQTLRAILRADMAQAAGRRVRGEDGRTLRGAIQRGEDEVLIRLVRRGWDNPDAAPRASMQAVEYRLEDGRLIRRAREALDAGVWREPQVLARDVVSGEVSFFHDGQWIDSLPGGPLDPMPQAVRIDLEFRHIGEISQVFVVGSATR